MTTQIYTSEKWISIIDFTDNTQSRDVELLSGKRKGEKRKEKEKEREGGERERERERERKT